MDKDAIGLVVLVGGAVCGVTAGLIRYGLLPYLREQLQQTREIHREVSPAPSPPAEPPTMREQLVELAGKVDEHAGELEDATLELRAMALMFDGHLEWSQREVDKLWAELNRQRDAGERPDRRPQHRKDTR